MSSLYEKIDLAHKFGDGKVAVTESVESSEPGKTSHALATMKRLSESKAKQPEPIPSLGAMPVPN